MRQNKPLPLAPNLGYLLANAAHYWRTGVASVLQPYDLTPPQFFMLMGVYRGQPTEQLPTQKQAAEHSTLNLNVASQVTKGLMSRGLIKRGVHPTDSRAYVLSLSKAGTTLARNSSADVRHYNDRFFARSDNQVLAKELHNLMEGKQNHVADNSYPDNHSQSSGYLAALDKRSRLARRR